MAVRDDDARLKKVGFCKLLGESIEHYAQKYEINIGRKSKATNLDVLIGDTNISRQHACIAYNFDKGAWELRVQGKNGVTVKNTIYTPNSPPVTLQSGDLLQFGDKAFFFLLEKGTRARQKDLKRPKSAGVVKPRTKQPSLKIVMPSADKAAETAKTTKPAAEAAEAAAPAPVSVKAPAPTRVTAAAAAEPQIEANPTPTMAASQQKPAPFQAVKPSAPPAQAPAQPILSGSEAGSQSKALPTARPNPPFAPPSAPTVSASLGASTAMPQKGQAPSAEALAQASVRPVEQRAPVAQPSLSQPRKIPGAPERTQPGAVQGASLPSPAPTASQPLNAAPSSSYGPLLFPGQSPFPAAGQSSNPAMARLQGYPRGLQTSGPGDASAAAPGLTSSAALQQLNLQAFLKAHQQQQAQQQALQMASQGMRPNPLQAFAGLTGSPALNPMLQQLMASNSSLPAEHGSARQNPLPFLPGLSAPGPDVRQGQQQANPPFYGFQTMPQRPAHASSGQMPNTYTSNTPLRSVGSSTAYQNPPNQLFPDGFPNQLLQGLEQHQYLQQHLPWDMSGNRPGGDHAPNDKSSADK